MISLILANLEGDKWQGGCFCLLICRKLLFRVYGIVVSLLGTVVSSIGNGCAKGLAQLCHRVGTVVSLRWHNCFDWLSWAKWALKKCKEKERIFKLQDLSLGNGLTIKRLFFYCQPYYQVLLSWYKRLFRRCLNTKSWQMTIECPKNSYVEATRTRWFLYMK